MQQTGAKGTWNKQSVEWQWPMEPIAFSYRCINTFSPILFSILFGILIFLSFVICIYFHALAPFRPTSQKHSVAAERYNSFTRSPSSTAANGAVDIYKKQHKLAVASKLLTNFNGIILCAVLQNVNPRKLLSICWLCAWRLALYCICKTFSSFRNVGYVRCAHFNLFPVFSFYSARFRFYLYLFVALVIFAYFHSILFVASHPKNLIQ